MQNAMAGVDVPSNENSTVAMQETEPHQPSAATSSSGKITGTNVFSPKIC